MTVSANSYGTAADVASYGRAFTNASGAFDTTTQPTLEDVEKYIDDVSSIVNVALADLGFTVPVTNTTAAAAIKATVIPICSDLVHAANSAGRFYSERYLTYGLSVMGGIRKEIRDWVEASANGLEAAGATRSETGESDGMQTGSVNLNFASSFDDTDY